MARAEIDDRYHFPDTEEWYFEGWNLPYEDVIELFYAWKEHGVMAVSGGYYDQPIQWRNDIKICERLYSDKMTEVLAEIELRKPPSG